MPRFRALAIVSALLFCFTATAQELTISFAHVDPADWTVSKKGAAALAFKNVIEGETGGRISVELFDSGSLGGELDLVQSAQDGTLEVAMVSGAFSQVCPEAGVLDIPYMFSSAPVAWEVLDGEFGEALAQHCLEKSGLRTLAYGETGFRHFTNSVRPIQSPDDMTGLKIRVQTIPLYVEMVKALGAEPTPIDWPEVPTALATGVIDGQENPISVIYSNGFYDMQDYITLDGHVYGTDFILVSDQFFQGLSEDDKNLFKRAAIIAGNMGRSIQQFNSAQGVSQLIAEGMEVYKPTSEELRQFRELAQPAVIDYLSEQVEEGWIEQLQDAVSQAEADF